MWATIDWLGQLPVLPLVYVAVKYWRGMDSHIRVHDVLDQFQTMFYRMSPGDLFASPTATLDWTLGGLPRNALGSEFAIGTVVSALLPMLWGLLVGELVYRLVAYYGMRRLLRTTGLASERVVYLAVPSLFAIIPFWHSGFAAVAGVPLLLSALINIHRRGSWRDYTIVGVFPTLCWAIVSVPYGLMLGLYALVGWATRRAPVAMVKAAALYTASLLVVEWRLVYGLLAGPESHRVEMSGLPPGLSTRVFSLGRRILEVLEKQADASSVTTVPVAVLLVVLAVSLVLISRRRPGGPARVLYVTLAAMVAVLIVATAWGYVETHVLRRVLDYPHFQMDRALFALPGLIYLAVGAAALVLLRRISRPLALMLIGAVFLIQGAASWSQADFSQPRFAEQTINEFFAPDLFSDVRSLVDERGGGRVVSVGFHPAVTIYNGMDAADGYWINYPLEYKHRWRSLIAPALEQDRGLRVYFDLWGSRAYLFQPELGMPSCCQIERANPFDLLIDVDALEDLGIRFVLSTGEITNADDLGFHLLADMSRPESTYRVLVYDTGL